MKPLVLSSMAAFIDTDAKDSYGLSDDQLMESAADKLYLALKTLEPWKQIQAGSILVAVCGKGNNAGDALAIVRKAALEGCLAVAAVVPTGLNAVAGRRLEEARRAGVRILTTGSLEAGEAIHRAAILLDGIAGTGMKGSLRAPFDSLAAAVSAADGTIVAIDVPSGVCLGSAMETSVVRADYTLSIAPSKLELYLPALRRYAGSIHEVCGVFSSSCAAGSSSVLLDGDDLPSLLPVLAPESYKGSRGTLGIFAGAVGTTGAALLAAKAGSASGAGTVTLMCRDEVWQVLASSLSAQMVKPLAAGTDRKFSAVLAGPGWGLDSVSSGLLAGLLASDTPLVLDADALRLLPASASGSKRQSGAPLVLTPHPGEFAGLVLHACGKDSKGSAASPADLHEAMNRALLDTPAILQQCAAFFDAVVVLKNHVTWIAAPDGRLAVWDGQEPALGTGGSGDVLAGLVAGLLARGASAYDAACAGVIAHGLSGREAAADLGFFEASALPAYAARILYRGTVRGNKR